MVATIMIATTAIIITRTVHVMSNILVVTILLQWDDNNGNDNQ